MDDSKNSKHMDKASATPNNFRKRIKPLVSVSAINRKSKQGPNTTKEITSNLIVQDVQKANNIQNEVLQNEIVSKGETPNLMPTAEETSRQKQVSVATVHSKSKNEVTLDETLLTPKNEIILKPQVPLDETAKKIIHNTNSNHNFDTEYLSPPPSPSKINRSRIKAIPRLSYRKTMNQKMRAEKNINRHRNDSMCSTTSGVIEQITECMSPQKPKEFNSIIQKKCNRTEQSRKLAEARREFQRRFGDNKPDRQKLTMIDLIFYNPKTNPMDDESKPKPEVTAANPEEEKLDDPDEINEVIDKSDEENEMPVPQIKIGPSGEIILDEKSLVIENKNVKKQREELQKTQLVDGDFNTSYGVYKRQKRSKNWSQSETLRFYKALNTIGTDFTLMCELFPRRTRRELKMKFKKEEKINWALINKAIMQPCSFDIGDLKHEVNMEEKEMEELQKQKEDEDKLRKQRQERKRKAPRPKIETAISEEKSENPPKPAKIRKIPKPKPNKLSIESVLDDSDADESDIGTQSESEEEISMPLRPTRSGRVPKMAKKFDNTEPMSTDYLLKKSTTTNVQAENIEPGSIMILTEKGMNGEPVYKIYMVTPDQQTTPLYLTSDVVSRAIELKKGLMAQNIVTISANTTDDETEDREIAEENNVTIPADENVTTLKVGKSVQNENQQEYSEMIVGHNITIPAGKNGLECCETTTEHNDQVECGGTTTVHTNITVPASQEHVGREGCSETDTENNVTVSANENHSESNEIKPEYVSDDGGTTIEHKATVTAIKNKLEFSEISVGHNGQLEFSETANYITISVDDNR
ncbi:hypothetical protein NQ317_009721 [Molorchus minor]|uniref:Myb-like domain-containing protein n=1 Tax=Molorchus minor TaxID=1323400 RepID=A0ABQ9JGA4_9CUCU|nr:hypothetical protein NQ317_009721 [Molorchus minor]